MSAIVSCRTETVIRPTVVMSTSYGTPPQEKKHVLVMLEDADGVRGWGESTPLPEFSGETADVVKLILEAELFPVVVGAESFDVAWIHRRVNEAIYGNDAAKMAIDTALYDLNAKKLGIPLYAMLGGKVRNEVPINRHLGIVDEGSACKQAAGYVEAGFRSIKMKVGRDVADDIARVKAVREEIGDRAAIRVDANGGYDRHAALRFVRGVEGYEVEIFEQLLPKWDIDGMAGLREATSWRLCADESACSPADVLELARRGACDFLTIKLIKTGGIYPAMRVAAIAEAAGIRCIVANTFDTQINCSACLHLASALPSADTAHDLTCFATQPALADTCHTLSDGLLAVGDEPGIGVRRLAEFDIAI